MPSSGSDQADISAGGFWQQPMRERDRTFAALRREPALTRHRPIRTAGADGAADFWAAVTHDDIVTVSRHPDLFCSSKGVGFSDIPPEYNEALGSFLMTDAPRHTQLRRLVSRAFTPRQVTAIDEQIAAQARSLVRATVEAGPCDLVDALAIPMPLWTISEMLGVPDERRAEFQQAANTMVQAQDPDFLTSGEDPFGQVLGAGITLSMLGVELAAERREHPQDDLLTALVQAEVDGERLQDEEIGAFCVLLGVAGNDTTRNSISHGVLAFHEHPDQWELLRAHPELLPTAVDEILRWASPVQTFRRTVTRPTELHGRPLAEGDHVVMFYGSGNRDEAVFVDPWRFDVTRTPNDHVAFGGGGPHYCLGANLARTQLRAVFGELLGPVAGFDVRDHKLLTGAFVNGVRRLEVTLDLATA